MRATRAANSPPLRSARWVAVALTCALVALALGWLNRQPEHAAPSGKASAAVDHYTCSMHPAVHQAAPGTCPMCGMALVPVSARALTEGVVTVNEASQKLAGVRTVAVSAQPLHLSFTGNGRVTYDETALADVTLRASGFITKLFVDSVGQRVDKDQPLFTLSSADLYSAQREFLQAGMGRGANAARERLGFLGMNASQIDALAASREPTRSVAITAPRSGFAILKEVVEGAYLPAGARVFRIGTTDKVWVEADVYDRDLMAVRAGQPAKVTLDYVPGQVYDALVAFVYPYAETSARTGRVRLEVANDPSAPALRPGMYATVQFEADAGMQLQVPTSAVMYTGRRRLVFLSLGDGRFRPQEIRVGREANGMYEVTGGLEAGQLVAASGTFLLAAEARISTDVKYWEAP